MNEYENMTKEELLTRCLFLDEVVAERNEQIERMKRCENCANHSFLIPEVDRYVKGKNPEKCKNCKYCPLNDGKGKDKWELEE